MHPLVYLCTNRQLQNTCCAAHMRTCTLAAARSVRAVTCDCSALSSGLQLLHPGSCFGCSHASILLGGLRGVQLCLPRLPVLRMCLEQSRSLRIQVLQLRCGFGRGLLKSRAFLPADLDLRSVKSALIGPLMSPSARHTQHQNAVASCRCCLTSAVLCSRRSSASFFSFPEHTYAHGRDVTLHDKVRLMQMGCDASPDIFAATAAADGRLAGRGACFRARCCRTGAPVADTIRVHERLSTHLAPHVPAAGT